MVCVYVCVCAYSVDIYSMHTDPYWCHNLGAVTAQSRLISQLSLYHGSPITGPRQIHDLSVVGEVLMRYTAMSEGTDQM